jgi:type IV pilus assembly protein PilP
MQKGKKGPKRKNHNTALHGSALLMFCFLLATCACSHPAESPKKSAPAKQVATPPAVKKPAIAAKKLSSLTEDFTQKVSAEFTYDPAGKPDPFIPLISEAAMTTQKAGVQEAPEAEDLAPLQKYDLSELNLVAIIIRDDNSRTAMVEDKAGYGYILKQGMLIGKNNGVIREITPTSIVIEEKAVDSSGKEKVNTITLSVTKTETGEI